MPRTSLALINEMSLIFFNVTLSAASMYIEPGSISFSGKTSGSLMYDSGMKLMQVLFTRNLLKLSRLQVTSISTICPRPPLEHQPRVFERWGHCCRQTLLVLRLDRQFVSNGRKNCGFPTQDQSHQVNWANAVITHKPEGFTLRLKPSSSPIHPSLVLFLSWSSPPRVTCDSWSV